MRTVGAAFKSEAPRAAEPGRYDAFLSYAHEDSEFAVARLGDGLRARGHQVWLDVEDILGGANWRERVERGIEACKAFIFVLSPASVASEHCRQELDDAVALHKLIIPVRYREVDEPQVPAALSDSAWVLLGDRDDPARGMDRLVEALEVDLSWRDQHTRLAGRAREWLDSGRDSSYALRGADLRDAEAWLGRQEGHRESPTREQVEYIARSRQAAGRRLYTLVGGLAVGLVIATGLAVFALIQRHIAIQESHVAESELLATQAGATSDLEVASLMALESYRLSPSVDARSAILTVVDGSGQLGRPFTGHAGPVTAVAFSPDGKTIASGSTDDTVRLWDVATHRQLGRPLTGHTNWVFDVAFSPDGKTLASGSADGTIRLWDVATHRQLGRPLSGRTDAVFAVAFSPDGRTLASGSRDHTVRLWDIATHRQLGRPLTGHTGVVNAVAFSPDGKTLASGSLDQTVRLWDVARRRELGGALTAHTDGGNVVAFDRYGMALSSSTVESVAFSPDGKTLASATAGGTIELRDVSTGRQLGPPLTGHTDIVTSAAFSPDGQILASGSADRTIRLWSNYPIDHYIRQLCRYIDLPLAKKLWQQAEPIIPYRRPC